jgi:hypothetical protein
MWTSSAKHPRRQAFAPITLSWIFGIEAAKSARGIGASGRKASNLAFKLGRQDKQKAWIGESCASKIGKPRFSDSARALQPGKRIRNGPDISAILRHTIRVPLVWFEKRSWPTRQASAAAPGRTLGGTPALKPIGWVTELWQELDERMAQRCGDEHSIKHHGRTLDRVLAPFGYWNAKTPVISDWGFWIISTL